MTSQTVPTRVGVWPGGKRDGTSFVDLFANGLRAAGAEVIDVQEPARIEKNSIDVFHIHWPEQVFWAGGGKLRIGWRILKTLYRLRRLKKSGVQIVWMVHNLEPHDMPWMRRVVWWFYGRQLGAIATGFMTLSPATIEVVRHNLPALRKKPGRSAWMPAYPHVEAKPSRSQVRSQLGITDQTHLFAFVGLLRPYKGVETLIDAIRELPYGDVELLIAGAPVDEAYAQALTDNVAGDPRIHMVFRHLSEEEFAGYQAAADVVVLPFRRYLHSASMLHAVCNHKPVVTPDTPFARALSQEVGADWVQIYEEDSLHLSMLRACLPPTLSPRLDALSPDALGRDTMSFYRDLLSERELSSV